MNNMKEIGGYFELESFNGDKYHKNSISLNCGRGCIDYLIELRDIHTIWLPDYMCSSVINLFIRKGVEVKKYHIGINFLPTYDFSINIGEWLFLCDFFGQLQDDDIKVAFDYSRGLLICDETQDFFRTPFPGVDTFYTCRKWFGVSDGAYLITGDGEKLERNIPIDKSRDRMLYILGRYEENASDYFEMSKKNNEFFDFEPVKQMSRITLNLLRAVDYIDVAKRRNDNWDIIDSALSAYNLLHLLKPKVPFMYPLLVDDAGNVREKLAEEKIYIPVLWPNVLEEDPKSFAYKYAKNIILLPIDQRYDADDMNRVIYLVKKYFV